MSYSGNDDRPRRHSRPTATLVIGLGNPILGDDGVGWRIAAEVARRIMGCAEDVEVDRLAVGGLSLMERMIGYDRVILVDAIATGQAPPGTVRCFPLDELPGAASAHSASAHDACLATALAMGRAIGASLPATIEVVGVELANVYDFSEELSPEIAAAVPLAAEIVIEALLAPGGRQRRRT